MSKERDFHNLIEKQNPEEKQELWERLERVCEAENYSEEISAPKRKVLSWRKITALATSFVLLATVITVGAWKIFLKDEGSKDQNRYCTQLEYDVISTKMTLKEYSQQIGEELLFFDWYEETDLLEDYVYRLKKDDDIIAFREEIIDINTGNLVKVHVTDNKTEIDVLEIYNKSCKEKSQIKDISIDWGVVPFCAYSYFEYNSYRYFIELEDPEDDGAILRLVETLLS